MLSVSATRRSPGSLRAASERARREGGDLGHAQVAQIQRARILAAMFDVVGEAGAANVSVADVVLRSGVSRRTFYELFEDREECFLAAFEQALASVAKQVLPAYEAEHGWRKRIGAALYELLRFLDEEPLVGKLLIVESLSGSQKALARRGEVLAEITRAIDAGNREAKGRGPGPLAAEAIVGGVLSVIHTRLVQPGEEPLVELTGPLMSMIVLPYLGTAAAGRELDRPAPVSVKQPREVGRLLPDPFKEAGMRLTYRTVRVLAAIVEHPGASNRSIGASAGIEDQGQISKLLSRIERIGLIVNTGMGAGTGTPNAWHLTDRGRQVAERISAYASEDGQ